MGPRADAGGRAPHRSAGLLRWYPATWRERYGDELDALMADSLGGRPPSPRFRLSIAWAGLRERAHGSGLVGDGSPPAERVRGGSLLVLCAWTAFVVGGVGFSKTSEHFVGTVPASGRPLSTGSFDAVQVLASVGAVLVVLGAVLVLPAFVRFLGAGGWPAIRRRVLWAGAATVVTVAAVIPLGVIAHRLNSAQRNGADWHYSVGFAVVALASVATLALWTAAAVAAVQRMELRTGLVVAESALATALAAVMVLITGSTALWWGSMAFSAPWFLQGTSTGTPGSPFELNIVVAMALMLGATLAAGFGVVRMSRSWSRLLSG